MLLSKTELNESLRLKLKEFNIVTTEQFSEYACSKRRLELLSRAVDIEKIELKQIYNALLRSGSIDKIPSDPNRRRQSYGFTIE